MSRDQLTMAAYLSLGVGPRRAIRLSPAHTQIDSAYTAQECETPTPSAQNQPTGAGSIGLAGNEFAITSEIP
jgi:hypothetical protein